MSLPKSVYRELPRRLPKSLGFSRYYLDFDGAEDFVRVSDDPSLDVSNITLMAWTRLDAVEPDEHIMIVKNYDGTNSPFQLEQNGDIYQFGFYDGTWEKAEGGTPEGDVWKHLAGTYDGSDVRLYINGDLIDTYSYSATLPTNDFPLGIGARTDWGSLGTTQNFIDGAIDEILLYDGVLSKSEITHNMLNYHNPIKTNLVAWWRFEEGTGLTAHDKSGNGNDGTLKPSDDPPTWIEQKKWEMRAEVGL